MSVWRIAAWSMVCLLTRTAGVCAAAEPTRAEYARLAAEVSQDYRMPGRQYDGVPHRLALEAAEKSSAAPIQRAAQMMLDGLNKERELLADKKAYREHLRSSARARLKAAERGAYVTRESYYDYGPTGQRIPVTVNRDDTAAAKLSAQMSLRMAETMTDERLAMSAKAVTRKMLERVRADAWEELEPVAKELAGPKSESPLAEVVHSDKTTFRLRSVAARPLTGVTVVVEFVHYSTLPHPTFRHVYYLPTWRPRQVVELSNWFVPDPKQSRGRWYRVAVYGRNAQGKWEPHPELPRMAGVVQTRVRVYANEAWREEDKITHADRVAAVAQVRLRQLEEYIMSPYANSKLVEMDLKPLAALLPPGGDQAQQAHRMLNDFEAVRAELLAAGDREFLELFAAGRRYEGRFFARNNNGRVGLIFVACDESGKTVRAELYDPKNPRAYRMFGGAVVKDPQTRRRMLVLSALAPTVNPSPRPNLPGLGMSVFDDAVKAITVRFNRRPGPPEHVWRASDEPPQRAIAENDPIGLVLKPAEPDARRLAAARQRVKENPRLKVPSFRTLVPATRGGLSPAARRRSPRGRTPNRRRGGVRGAARTR